MAQDFFKAAELKVSYKCNMGCRFCWVGDRRTVKDLSLEEQLENLRYIKADPNIEEIHISGGEPTIRKELIELLQAVRDQGFKTVVMHTNAMNLADDEYASQVVPYLDNAVISLQAGTEDRHQFITRVKDKLEVQKQGIRNTIKYGANVVVNTVMTRHTVMDMPVIAKTLTELGVLGWLVTFPFVTGWAGKNKEDLIPQSLDELFPYLPQALDIAKENGLAIVPNGLPFCYLPDYIPQFLSGMQYVNANGFGGFGSNRRMVDHNDQKDEGMAFAHEVIQVEFSETCHSCVFKGACTGFWPDLLKLPGFPELKAVM